MHTDVVIEVHINPLNKRQRLIHIPAHSSGKWRSGKAKAIGMPAPTLYLSNQILGDFITTEFRSQEPGVRILVSES